MDCNAKPLVASAGRSCIPPFCGLPVDRARPRWRIVTQQNLQAVVDWSFSPSTADMADFSASGVLAFPSVGSSDQMGCGQVDASTAYTLSATHPETMTYLVLPARGRYTAPEPAQGLHIDWSVVSQIIVADRLNEPHADSVYAGLISQILMPFIPASESALSQARWCEPEALQIALSTHRYVRMRLNTAELIGSDLTLYAPESSVETALQSWRSSSAFAQQLAATFRWLPPIALTIALPCAHMSALDLHRLRSGYVIRLAMMQREGHRIAVSGFASGGNFQRQSGWCPVAWNVLLHWEQAEATDHFFITWSQPMQDMDDMPFAPGSAGSQAGLNALHLPAPMPAPLPSPDSRVTVTLECVLGAQSYRLEDLMQIRPGELLSFTEWQWPTVSLRLSGQTLGVGELVLCGDELAVQVTQWYPSEGSDEQPV